ncbi:hypothetical protein MHU86_14563 [Fragilaria crotonensis]|nr:hypothetical protein MHU86_14563 [Fragilaria crotonensis]
MTTTTALPTQLDSSATEFWDTIVADDNNNNDNGGGATYATSDSSDVSPVLDIAEYEFLTLTTESEASLFHDALEDLDHWYGRPKEPEQAMEAFPPSNRGLTWKAEVLPNTWWNGNGNGGNGGGGQLLKGLKERDFDLPNRRINSHRGTLPLTQEDLLSSLVKTPDGRLIFCGKLNGWPQLSILQLVSLERKRILPFNKAQYSPYWSPSKGKLELERNVMYRATFLGPGWTSIGWSEASPGFVFWFESSIPRFTYGTNLLHTLSSENKVSHVHMISHRYAIRNETPRDLLTYHSVVLLEWEHGKYCTVVEGAYLNGIGGYNCRSNWYQDKDEPNNLLSQHMPEELKGPWRTSAGEIRCYDVPQANITEFMEYMDRFKGNDARFVDPQITFSHKARLSFRSKRDLAQYLLNYVGRDCSYQELRKNCQTFAADLCAFFGREEISRSLPSSGTD